MQHSEPSHSVSDEDDAPQSVCQFDRDMCFISDGRIIEDLLYDQIRYHTPPSYCHGETHSSGVFCRRTLLNWIREVCDHRGAPTEVLAHTILLIDRFMSHSKTDKREYQLVGASCLLISTKLKETVPVSVEDLVQYSDFSITKDDICMKELFIVITLSYDLSLISVCDFIKPLVDRCPVSEALNKIIRRQSNALYHKVAHASSCILHATGLLDHPEVNQGLIQHMKNEFIKLLKMDPDKLNDTSKFLQSLFVPGTTDLSEFVRRVDRGGAHSDALITPDHPSNSASYTPPEASTSSNSNTSTSSFQGADIDSAYHEGANTESDEDNSGEAFI